MNTGRILVEALAHSKQRREEDNKRLAEIYSTTFRTRCGLLVLSDLLAAYGFDENGIERPTVKTGGTFEDAARIDGSKEVVRHILANAGFRISFDEPTAKKT